MNNLLRRPQRQRIISFWQRWALNIGATLGSLCLIVAVLTLVFGLKPLIFVSGSMGPDIPTGSLGLALPTPVAELVPGQVVSVETTDGTRVTHRMVENRPEGLILKGDANSTADLQPYPVTSADRLLVSVPLLGYVVSWFSQPWAFFVGGLLCAYLLYLAFFRRVTDAAAGGDGPCDTSDSSRGLASRAQPEDKVLPRNRNRIIRGTGTVLTMLALVAGLGINARAEPTEAAFNGQASANATAAALTASPPTGVTCTNNAPNAQTIRFDWTGATPAPTGYIVTGRLNNSTSNPTSVRLPANARTYSTSISAESGLLGSLLNLLLGFNNRFTVEISAEYGTWKSSPVSFPSVHGTAGVLGINKKLTCT